MRIKILLFVALFLGISTTITYAQNPIDTSGKIYQKGEVDINADCKGGIYEIAKRFSNRDLPNNSSFKIVFQLIVEPDGRATDIKITDTEAIGLDENLIETFIKDALRRLNTIKEWQPAQKDGKKVRYLYTMPITMKGAQHP